MDYREQRLKRCLTDILLCHELEQQPRIVWGLQIITNQSEYNMIMADKVLYRCPECGLHYEDEQIAKQCEAYCKEHQGCSMEITKLSVERSKASGNPQS